MINNSSKLFEEIFSEEIISNESFRSKVPTGIIVFAGLFFTASGFFSSMRTVLNKVNGTYVDINFFLGKLRDLLVNLFAILLFFASILALHLLELIISIAYSNSQLQFFNHPIFQQFFTILVSLIITLILIY